MKKRLFAWLLAVVLALSMGAAPTPGQTPGAEQAEQGADVSVQTPDTADASEDDTPADEPGEDDGTGEGSEDAGPVDENGEDGENDAPAGEEGETGENDTLAGEPGEGGEDDAPAGGDSEDDGPDNEDDGPVDTDSEPGGDAGPVDEDSGDGGETVPAPINNAPSNDEPQTTADGVVKVTLVDDEGYVTWVSDSVTTYYSTYDGPLTSRSYVLNQGAELHLEAKACELDVKGGHVTEKHYRLNEATGYLSVDYEVEPDGTGDMTVTTMPDDQAPKPIEIDYAGEEGKIKNQDNYVLPVHSFSVELEEGYTISVEGGVSSVDTYKNGMGKECYMVHVSEDATSIKVIVTAANAGATLSATIPDAVESNDLNDRYEMREVLGRAYVGHNGTMENGKGWFLLKNGYAVGPGVTGGSVWLRSIIFDETTGSIHTCYIVDATADTVTVPIVEARPYQWVDVKVDNDVGCHCTVRNVLPAGETYSSKDENHLVVLDELTVTLNTPGYELVAVSGCTLRWEKGADGKVTYRIFPDGAGDTSVQLRVVDAGRQEPVLKVMTDATVGVQTDAAAEGLLEAAIDTLAKGGVPAGMSQDTAEKLRAALAEADAVTVPELSAVLNVKQGDRTAVPGADAVYEIGIVLRVNGQEVGSLTELSQSISIGLPLPQQLAGRIVYVVRSHEGKQERLDATVQNGVIRFATDRFSEFAIMSGNDLADAAVDPIPDQTRTGAAVTPKVRVTITGPTGEETLREGVDYELVYKDNVNAGTATVTVTGIGDFAGTSVTLSFRILEAEAETTTPDSMPSSIPDSIPATGDETPLALYTGLLALSASGLAAVLLRRKKQR